MTKRTRWLLGLGSGIFGLFGVSGVALGLGWSYVDQTLPAIEPLARYEPPEVTVMLDRHGVVIGELYDERRYVLPITAIPKHVQDAFLAAEDASFRSHWGIDVFGIARAMVRNVDEGRAAQGASTITQQVVKNLVLRDREKSIERKLKEVVLSFKVESNYDKDHILFLYLNSIYLGSQSYGVEAAARTYFGKHVEDLSIAESALLAGLPQRPSDYNPYRNLPRAQERQLYVIGRMVANGFITAEQGEQARLEPIVLRAPDNLFLKQAPHFTEHVRRQLVERFGEELAHRGGLSVITTCDLGLQTVAQAAVHDRVTELDNESGFRRGGMVTLAPDAIDGWRADAARSRGTAPLVLDQVYEAVVLSVAADRALLAIGNDEVMIGIADHGWISANGRAYTFQERIATQEQRSEYWAKLEARRERDEAAAAEQAMSGLPEEAVPAVPASRVELERPGEQLLQEGDLVRVTLKESGTLRARDGRMLPRALLKQDRELEGALLSMEVDTGAVRALVGGADFAGSQFNRATQARRQVGSTFKPFVYAAAIASKKMTAATLVSDLSVSIPLANNKFWTPRGGGSEHPYTLARGLALSRNVIAVRTLLKIDPGMDNDVVYDFARSLGLGGLRSGATPADWIATPETQYLCPFTSENVSAVFCRDHLPALDEPEPDMASHRRTIEADTDHLCRSCDYSMGLGSASLTLTEMVRAYSVFATEGRLVEPYTIEQVRDRHGNVIFNATPERPQVIDPGVAHIVNFMLQGVVSRGTGSRARELGGHLAGKTGTTDDGRDAWFIGMSPKVVTGVWIGFDTPQTIGNRATGGRVALPVWMKFMKEVVDKDEVWPEPSPEHVVFANISESSGGRSLGGGSRYPFLPGTIPPVLAEPVVAGSDEPVVSTAALQDLD